MKTFLIVSDSHGRRKAIDKITPLTGENDYLIHLGDGVGDFREIMRK